MFRSDHSFAARRRLALALFAALLPLGFGCASGGAGNQETAPPATQPATKPISGKLAQVKVGMSDTDVRSLLGEPSRTGSYPTAKNWIPFYYGSDRWRTDYVYEGLGKVVFSRNAYTQALKVVAVVPE